MTVLAIDNLVVSLGKNPSEPRIIDGISLELSERETLCLVGESGSGKSVTALTVMGLLQKNALSPTGGSIKLVGEELLTASDRRLRQLRATPPDESAPHPPRSCHRISERLNP